MNETTIIRALTRSIVATLLAAALAYPADWLLWQLRVLAGKGSGRVTVRQLTVAALKGNREAYFPGSTVEVPCSRSLSHNPERAPAGGCIVTPRSWSATRANLLKVYSGSRLRTPFSIKETAKGPV